MAPALLSVSRESDLVWLFWGVTRREFLYLDSLDFEAEDIQKVEYIALVMINCRVEQCNSLHLMEDYRIIQVSYVTT